MDKRPGWSQVAGMAVSTVAGLGAVYWSSQFGAREPNYLPLVAFGVAVAFGFYFAAAPLVGWWPWRAVDIRRRLAARLLPRLRELVELGARADPLASQDYGQGRTVVTAWLRDVWTELNTYDVGMAGRFGSPDVLDSLYPNEMVVLLLRERRQALDLIVSDLERFEA
jgi:hypothetical protein